MGFFYPGIFNYIVYKFDNQVYECQNSEVDIVFFKCFPFILSFNCVIPFTSHQHLLTNCQLPTAYQLPTANCLLPTAYSPLPTA